MGIIVHTKPNCVQYNATKRTMDKYGLDYDTVDLTQDTSALNRVKELRLSQAPMVVAGEDAWSGFCPDKIKESSTIVETVAIQTHLASNKFKDLMWGTRVFPKSTVSTDCFRSAR